LKNLILKGAVMKKQLDSLLHKIQRFHRNESGMETLQVVLIIALAAIAAVVIYKFGGMAVKFMYDCFYGSDYYKNY